LLPVDATPDLEEELSTKLAELAALQKKIKQADKMTLGKAFDPFRNIASLLEQAPTRTLGGLDGLRTISMFMIILAHSALLSLMLGQQTTTFYLDYEHKFDSAFVMGVDKAVDTFFLISGILMSYTTIGTLLVFFLIRTLHSRMLLRFTMLLGLKPDHVCDPTTCLSGDPTPCLCGSGVHFSHQCCHK
jgi:hypothetical protein